MAPTQKTTVTSLGEHLPQESTGTPTHATLHPTPNPTHHLHVATAVQKGLSSHQNSIFVLFLELIHLFHPVLTGVLVENRHLWETIFAPKSTST